MQSENSSSNVSANKDFLKDQRKKIKKQNREIAQKRDEE